ARLSCPGEIDRVRENEEALHPTRAGIVKIAPVLGLEQRIDLVAAAPGLTYVKSAAVDRPLRDFSYVRNECGIGKSRIVADNDRRQVIEIFERLEIENRVGGVADENHGVGLQLLELQHLTGHIGAVGVIWNLRAHIDAGAPRSLYDRAGNRSSIVGVLVDDGDGFDLASGLFQIVEELRVSGGEIRRNGPGAKNPFEAATVDVQSDRVGHQEWNALAFGNRCGNERNRGMIGPKHRDDLLLRDQAQGLGLPDLRVPWVIHVDELDLGAAQVRQARAGRK